MDALYYDQTLQLKHDYPRPERRRGESLIRVLKSGICLTDIHLTNGYLSFTGVLGHEFVGIVEESDDASLVGQRVVGEINAACHDCPTCRMGNPTHCPNRTSLGIDRRDGAHAHYTQLPDVNLLRVPANVSDDEAVFTEPLAAACEVVQQHHILPTDRVVVIGDGKLGLLVAQVVGLTGCELHVIGRHAAKLAILEARGIVTEQIQRDEDSRLLTNWADVVIECTGNSSGFAMARRLVRPRGTFILKSTYGGEIGVDLSALVVDEVTLLGSRCGPFAPALRLLSAGLVDVASLLTATYPLAEGMAAMEHATRKGTLKVMLDMA
jgi:threonine dehydrogenase-like Zn-dependent dehydrogenase